MLYCHGFQKELKRGLDGDLEGSPNRKPANRYVVIMRGFLSYWLQKKFSHLGVDEEEPGSILRDFVEAYDLQMELITPNMRHLWLQQWKEDPKRFDQKFIKVNNVSELRRLLATQLYGTKTHMQLGTWEAPLLQSILDQDKVIDVNAKSEVIDVNKSHHRAKVFSSIARQDERDLKASASPAKLDVRKTPLRQMYQIRGQTQMSRREQYASELKTEVVGRLKREQLQKRINEFS